MRLTLKAQLDLDSLFATVEEELSNANPDTIDGVGADSDSEYEVSSWEVSNDGDGRFTVEIELDRISGKFASKDEVEEQVRDALDDIEYLELS